MDEDEFHYVPPPRGWQAAVSSLRVSFPSPFPASALGSEAGPCQTHSGRPRADYLVLLLEPLLQVPDIAEINQEAIIIIIV